MAFGQELPDDPYPLANAAQSGEGIFAPVDNLIYGMTPEEWYALTPEEQKRAAAAFLMRPEYQRVEYGTPGGMQGFGPSRYREIDPQKYAMGQAMLDQLQNDEDREEEANRRRIRDQLLRDKQGYGGGTITGGPIDLETKGFIPPDDAPYGPWQPPTATIEPQAADPNITDSEMALLAGEGRLAMNQSNQNYNQTRRGGEESAPAPGNPNFDAAKFHFSKAAEARERADSIARAMGSIDDTSGGYQENLQQLLGARAAEEHHMKEAKKFEAAWFAESNTADAGGGDGGGDGGGGGLTSEEIAAKKRAALGLGGDSQSSDGPGAPNVQHVKPSGGGPLLQPFLGAGTSTANLLEQAAEQAAEQGKADPFTLGVRFFKSVSGEMIDIYNLSPTEKIRFAIDFWAGNYEPVG